MRPDLILIDGGKGQLGVAREVLIDLGLADLPSVGVAKGEERSPGMEDLIFPDARPPLHLGPEHPALLLMQEIRDEAHRFADRRPSRPARQGAAHIDAGGALRASGRRGASSCWRSSAGCRACWRQRSRICAASSGISRRLAEQIYQQLH